MKSKFLFLAVVIIAMVLNGSAEENISSGIQNYYETEKNLSDINTDIDILKADIEEIELEISPLNDKKDTLIAEIEKENERIIDIGNSIENTKNDIENMGGRKSEFDANKGFSYRIASMLPAFIVGVWISIIILIFVWRGE